MIKNLTVAITDRCNGKCVFCNISRHFRNELTAEQFSQILDNPLFAQIEVLSLSGGEMFLHPDIEQILTMSVCKPKKLQRLFVNTNGLTDPKRIAELLLRIPRSIPCIVSVSYEGGPEENKAIRGCDNSDHIAQLAALLQGAPHISISLSMTLCAVNCRLSSLEGTKAFAQKLNCDYSFRFSEVSEMYYRNEDYRFVPTDEQIRDVVGFINENCQHNPFLKKYATYLQTGKVCYGGKPRKCIAGSVLAFVNTDGNIYPCIYAQKAIGSITEQTLQTMEPFEHCRACYTDCTAWPMIEYYELGAYQQ